MQIELNASLVVLLMDDVRYTDFLKISRGDAMRLEITSESHNRVDWVVRTKIIWMEAGLILGVFIATIISLRQPVQSVGVSYPG